MGEEGGKARREGGKRELEPEMRIERDWGIGEGRWEAGGGAEGEGVMDR